MKYIVFILLFIIFVPHASNAYAEDVLKMPQKEQFEDEEKYWDAIIEYNRKSIENDERFLRKHEKNIEWARRFLMEHNLLPTSADESI